MALFAGARAPLSLQGVVVAGVRAVVGRTRLGQWSVQKKAPRMRGRGSEEDGDKYR